jgi:hypothetical protein
MGTVDVASTYDDINFFWFLFAAALIIAEIDVFTWMLRRPPATEGVARFYWAMTMVSGICLWWVAFFATGPGQYLLGYGGPVVILSSWYWSWRWAVIRKRANYLTVRHQLDRAFVELSDLTQQVEKELGDTIHQIDVLAREAMSGSDAASNDDVDTIRAMSGFSDVPVVEWSTVPVTKTEFTFSASSSCPKGHIAVHFLEPSDDGHVMRVCSECDAHWLERV